MRILLDTHIFLWFISGDIQLSTVVRDEIRDPDKEVYLSAISVWEPPYTRPSPINASSEMRSRHNLWLLVKGELQSKLNLLGEGRSSLWIEPPA